jgi:hypothetical protein
MTSSQHGLYVLGDTHATMARTMGSQAREREPISKARRSSDCRLQLACMKSELLVTVDQPRYGEYVPGPCTHRPSRHGSWSRLKSGEGRANRNKEAAAALLSRDRETGYGSW